MKCEKCKCEIPDDNKTVICKVDLSFDIGTGIGVGSHGNGLARLTAADLVEPHKFCSVGCMIEYLKKEASKAVYEYLKK